MRHGIANRDLVSDLCRLLPGFVNKCAAHLCGDVLHRPTVFDGCIRLGIEALLVSHAAGQVDEDHRLRCSFNTCVAFNIRLSFFQLEELSQ